MSNQPTISSINELFYISLIDEGGIIPAMGNEVVFPGFEPLRFFVHSNTEEIYDDEGYLISEIEWWKISEYSTGMSIPLKKNVYRLDSKENAVYYGYMTLKKKGLDKITAIIESKPQVPYYSKS